MNRCVSASPKDPAIDLVTSQLNFGLAYALEARSAYDSDRRDYGDLARDIAAKAYAAAIRFAARVSGGVDASTSEGMKKLEGELHDLRRTEELETRAIA